MRRLLGVLAVLALPLAPHAGVPSADAVDGASSPNVGWKRVDVDTSEQLRGLAVVGPRRAWVGGSEGGVWKTSDGGRTWRDVSPPGARKAGLLLRDVEATDARTVQVMAIGEGRASRIYRTTDAGRTWRKTFVNRDPRAFYDCMAMWPDGRHGIAMSDPVDGKFRIIATRNGGASWRKVSPRGMPAAVEGEFGFAASGTCLVAVGSRTAYLGSGGGASRIFVSRDRGRTWKVRDSTIPASSAGGVFSLAFRTVRAGLAVGGDFEAEDNGVDMSALTRNGGRSWFNGGDLGGYRSGVDFWRGRTAIAVGPNGSDLTSDGGRSWTPISRAGFDAVQCVRRSCWASGPEGKVARLRER